MLSRRSAFRLAGVVATGAFVAACSADDADTVPPVDPLIAHAELARGDAAAATAAIAVLADRAPALQLVAAERTAHAEALTKEVDRAAGTSTTAVPTSPAAPADPPTLDAVRGRLGDSQRRAADLARTLSDYRAGLLGSISAACAVHAAVVLA